MKDEFYSSLFLVGASKSFSGSGVEARHLYRF
jgi:hypothetical protein